MTHSIQTLTADFLGTDVNIIDRNGQRWLTAEQAARARGIAI